MFMQRRDFTLIELLSVIGIIAIVAAIILGGMNYASRRADEAKTIAAMESLIMALDAFKQDRGYSPPAANLSNVEFLLVSNEVNIRLDGENYPFFNRSTNRPYIELGVVSDDASQPTEYTDAQGEPFQYQCPGTNNTASYDLQSGGMPEICNWKRR